MIWREIPRSRYGACFSAGCWPFEGDLERLTADSGIVVAEIYPLAAYATALEPCLPAPVLKIAKTKRDAREKALARLTAAAWVAEHGVILHDLDAALESEDDFDALVTAAALVRTVVEQRPACWEASIPGGLLLRQDAIGFSPIEDLDRTSVHAELSGKRGQSTRASAGGCRNNEEEQP